MRRILTAAALMVLGLAHALFAEPAFAQGQGRDPFNGQFAAF
jgi:hypothetical protein